MGCGTGLSGAAFADISGRISGIDISPKIVEVARKKEIYETLHVGDIIDILDETREKFDLFVAADVFVYMGDLDSVFTSVQSHSSNGAYFVFSTESTDQNDYVLRPSGRYAHSPTYIRTLARRHGFSVKVCENAGLRREMGQWIMGDLFILQYIPT